MGRQYSRSTSIAKECVGLAQGSRCSRKQWRRQWQQQQQWEQRAEHQNRQEEILRDQPQWAKQREHELSASMFAHHRGRLQQEFAPQQSSVSSQPCTFGEGPQCGAGVSRSRSCGPPLGGGLPKSQLRSPHGRKCKTTSFFSKTVDIRAELE